MSRVINRNNYSTQRNSYLRFIATAINYMDKNKKYYELVDISGKIYTETLHIIINKNSKIKNVINPEIIVASNHRL